MPFSRYLQDGLDDDVEHHDQAPVQFQLPSFMYAGGVPTLAPGGGAEVVPYSPSWYTNVDSFENTYTPVTSDVSLVSMITAPSPLGMPMYSASGFDLLSILARVATRPNPRIVLGPVDLTCSFVVVDVRRYDHPIVYCSPSFCRLTGYSEHEILGRNCRFLQAPGGAVLRGEQRRFTSHQSVTLMKKALVADKEVQTSIVNFKKDGSAFINLVSVVPILGGVTGSKHEANDVAYHVGFQVDLTEQPNVILEKLRAGTYLIEPEPTSANVNHQQLKSSPTDQKKAYTVQTVHMSPTLAVMLKNRKFMQSLPISTSTTVPPPLSASASAKDPQATAMANNSPLSLILLEYAPDFIHVVSLKGAFLYVAPSVRNVLGYEPAELVGKCMADLAHPEDVVPLERQLKESSALVRTGDANDETGGGAQVRPVDVLFRARTKGGRYVWVECRGRLHVEPGKGRKAIVLSGRAREMARVEWRDVVRGAGGLSPPVVNVVQGRKRKSVGSAMRKEERVVVETEFWAMVTGVGRSAGALTVLGKGVKDVLGWEPEDLVGKRIGTLVLDAAEAAVEEALRDDNGDTVHSMYCALRRKDGGTQQVLLAFYRSVPWRDAAVVVQLNVSPAPVLVQVKRVDGASTSVVQHPLEANIFEDLETTRNSSWQYELQQLRFANQRLKDEIKALEIQLGDVRSPTTTNSTSSKSTTTTIVPAAPSSTRSLAPAASSVPSHAAQLGFANLEMGVNSYSGQTLPLPLAFSGYPSASSVYPNPQSEVEVSSPGSGSDGYYSQQQPSQLMQGLYAPVPLPVTGGRPSSSSLMQMAGAALEWGTVKRGF
ncbi:White collar 1 protein [Hypsizygus marmoreus]|uniref:White collar 1 protein n=1 Tax=Hypsizygus marmoreus TaxID=39966 RepID=A0A369KBB3_HYPMA|nr:White collar 1 protein [Hypsizygus marmoreus]